MRSFFTYLGHVSLLKKFFIEARNIAVYLLRYLRGDSLSAIGKVFDIESYSAVSSIIERLKARMHTEKKLLRKVEVIRKRFMRQK